MCIRDSYMDADFVKEHPYIYLSVNGEDMIFQITALFVTDIGFDYIAPNPTGDDLTSFSETVARKNWLDFADVYKRQNQGCRHHDCPRLRHL